MGQCGHLVSSRSVNIPASYISRKVLSSLDILISFPKKMFGGMYVSEVRSLLNDMYLCMRKIYNHVVTFFYLTWKTFLVFGQCFHLRRTTWILAAILRVPNFSLQNLFLPQISTRDVGTVQKTLNGTLYLNI